MQGSGAVLILRIHIRVVGKEYLRQRVLALLRRQMQWCKAAGVLRIDVRPIG